MDFYTIDFETANQHLDSACSIGIVGVKNNKIAKEWHYLINPKQPFDPFNISIHNIKEEDVANALTFDQLWDEISFVFDHSIVLAHNAGFDIAVLTALLKRYNISYPEFSYGCTVRIARGLWSKDEVRNHRLNTIAGYLELDFKHHDALSDAVACCQIALRGMKIYQTYEISKLYDELHLRFGKVSPKRCYSTHVVRRKHPIKSDVFDSKLILILGKPQVMSLRRFVKCLEENNAYVERKDVKRCDGIVVCKEASDEEKHMIFDYLENDDSICVWTEEEVFAYINS